MAPVAGIVTQLVTRRLGADRLLAKSVQGVRHRPWLGLTRFISPPESAGIRVRWCQTWVSPGAARERIHAALSYHGMTRAWVTSLAVFKTGFVEVPHRSLTSADAVYADRA